MHAEYSDNLRTVEPLYCRHTWGSITCPYFKGSFVRFSIYTYVDETVDSVLIKRCPYFGGPR